MLEFIRFEKPVFPAVPIIIAKRKYVRVEKKIKLVTPVYQQIAADIASKIVGGRYRPNEKIYARSALASQYGVSSETARRAICVLSDMDIVDATKGSGVVIKSRENAARFVKQFENIQTVNTLKKQILESVARQKQENACLEDLISDLINRTDRFRSTNPFVPFEITVEGRTPYLNRTVSEINFWHNTSATIIAIRRGDDLMMSPGPYASFQEGDIVYFIGDEDCAERVRVFLYPD